MHDGFERTPGVGVGEDPLAHRAAIEPAIRTQNGLAEVFPDRRESGRAGCDDRSTDLVGVEDDGAEFAKPIGDRGFAGGHAAGQGQNERSHGPQ